MAEKSTVYRASIALSDIDRGVYAELPLTLACHPSETRERLVARLLAYAVNYQEGLSFSKGICDGDSPDIWLHDANEHIAQWIEVGLPTPERIQEACKRAKLASFYLYGRRLGNWQQMHGQKLAGLDNLRLVEIPAELMEALLKTINRSMNWSLTITEGVLYLDADGQHIEGGLPEITLG